MASMEYCNGHIHGFSRIYAASGASSGAAPETRGRLEEVTPDFEAELKARYERLSLLTLDLAEEAGRSRQVAEMTRAIWVHRTIEKLRTGKPALHFSKRKAHDKAPYEGSEFTGGVEQNVPHETPGEINRMRTISDGADRSVFAPGGAVPSEKEVVESGEQPVRSAQSLPFDATAHGAGRKNPFAGENPETMRPSAHLEACGFP